MEAIVMHEHSLIIEEYNENNKYENENTYKEYDSIKNLIFKLFYLNNKFYFIFNLYFSLKKIINI